MSEFGRHECNQAVGTMSAHGIFLAGLAFLLVLTSCAGGPDLSGERWMSQAGQTPAMFQGDALKRRESSPCPVPEGKAMSAPTLPLALHGYPDDAIYFTPAYDKKMQEALDDPERSKAVFRMAMERKYELAGVFCVVSLNSASPERPLDVQAIRLPWDRFGRVVGFVVDSDQSTLLVLSLELGFNGRVRPRVSLLDVYPNQPDKPIVFTEALDGDWVDLTSLDYLELLGAGSLNMVAWSHRPEEIHLLVENESLFRFPFPRERTRSLNEIRVKRVVPMLRRKSVVFLDTNGALGQLYLPDLEEGTPQNQELQGRLDTFLMMRKVPALERVTAVDAAQPPTWEEGSACVLTHSKAGVGDIAASPDLQWLVLSLNDGAVVFCSVETLQVAERHDDWLDGPARLIFSRGAGDRLLAVDEGGKMIAFEIHANRESPIVGSAVTHVGRGRVSGTRVVGASLIKDILFTVGNDRPRVAIATEDDIRIFDWPDLSEVGKLRHFETALPLRLIDINDDEVEHAELVGRVEDGFQLVVRRDALDGRAAERGFDEKLAAEIDRAVRQANLLAPTERVSDVLQNDVPGGSANGDAERYRRALGIVKEQVARYMGTPRVVPHPKQSGRGAPFLVTAGKGDAIRFPLPQRLSERIYDRGGVSFFDVALGYRIDRTSAPYAVEIERVVVTDRDLGTRFELTWHSGDVKRYEPDKLDRKYKPMPISLGVPSGAS